MTSKHLIGAAAIVAVSLVPVTDALFLPLVLFGPLITGLVVGVRRGDARGAAAMWAVVGLGWLVVDWIVNDEDQLFHLVLACLMAGLVAIGALVGRSVGRRPRTT